MPRMPQFEQRWAAVILLGIALLTVTATVVLLDYSQAHADILNTLLLAGSAGAAASCLGVLLRQGGFTSLRSSSERSSLLISVITPIAGFAAGAFSLLLALALLTPVNSPHNPASAAVFGGIYGLLLGGWSQKLLAAPVVGDAAHTLKSVVSTTASNFFLDKARIRYNGRVGASIRSVEGVDLVQGVLGVRFIPSVGPDQKLNPGERDSQVIVDDGEDAPLVNFVITVVSGSGLESYPQSRTVGVPSDQTSEKFEFTLVREPTSSEESGATGAIPAARSILIDVSQAGRTIQLLELPTPEMQRQGSAP